MGCRSCGWRLNLLCHRVGAQKVFPFFLPNFLALLLSHRIGLCGGGLNRSGNSILFLRAHIVTIRYIKQGYSDTIGAPHWKLFKRQFDENSSLTLESFRTTESYCPRNFVVRIPATAVNIISCPATGHWVIESQEFTQWAPTWLNKVKTRKRSERTQKAANSRVV